MLNGRWGPYVTDGNKNVKVPKDQDPKDLSLAECEEMIANAPIKRGRFGAKKKVVKKAAIKKKVVKKKAVKKKAESEKPIIEISVQAESENQEVKKAYKPGVKDKDVEEALKNIEKAKKSIKKKKITAKGPPPKYPEKDEKQYIDEPLGSREDHKKMSGRSWAESKKDKIS